MAKDQNGEISEFEVTLIEAEENLVADFQFALNWLLDEKKMSKKDLADLLDVSKVRVTKLLGGSANPTLRTVARSFRALNEVCEISTPLLKKLRAQNNTWNASTAEWRQDLDECEMTLARKTKRKRSAPQKEEYRKAVDAILEARVLAYCDNDNFGWKLTDDSNELVSA